MAVIRSTFFVPMRKTMKKFVLTAACAALVATGCFGNAAEAEVANRSDNRSEQLQKAVKVKNMRLHQKALQNIADKNGGNRASGFPGFLKSVEYVRRELREAGYKVKTLTFDFPFYQKNAPGQFSQSQPLTRSFTEGTDFETMDYSGRGSVTAVVQSVTGGLVFPPVGGSANGCLAADFAGFTPGNIALIQRGTCTFQEKAENAAAAGASAVIIFNEGNTPGRLDAFVGTLGAPQTLPAIFVTHAIGAELLQTPSTVTVTTDTTSEIRQTYNLLAETSGNPDQVVVVGSHLDSVIEGPGIEDNGSGSSANLEIALQMSKGKFKPKNQVRFMWFGAEEAGLLGSEDYVASLSDADRAKISVNLNFDMIASPNFVRFVYDGDGSDTPDAGPAGSADIEQVFADHFAAKGLPFEPTAFDGRSDYGPFIDAGIPAGGLFTGAEDLKTAEQQVIYGGTVGEQLDPCYHEACDTYDNNNEVVFEEMANAAAHAVWTFANRAVVAPAATARSVARVASSKRSWDYKGGHLQR
jgi:Zn-dependent M28 family amino/carboxypeptidase